MHEREIDTKAGVFRARVLTDVRDERADVTVIIVNSLTSRMTLNAIASFRKFNDVPTNYVIVDNFSEKWILDDLVKEAGDFATIVSVWGEPMSIKMGHWDSQLNAIGVDIGSRFVHTRLGFVCHNDVLACRRGWLRHLVERIEGDCRGAAFLRDVSRINAMHVSGYLYDAGLYTREVADWYPVRGELDVGDHYTKLLRERGLNYFVCPNTHNDDGVAVPTSGDPTVQSGNLANGVKCLDGEGNVLYMHMGRGSLKSIGQYNKPGRTTHDDWLAFGKWVIEKWG